MKIQAKDVLWKGIIEDLFSDFLRFFYIHADEVFDIDRGFDFLDKELDQLYPGPDGGRSKLADKLVKVYKRDGEEEWLLIHIEVQGYYDKTFPRRMFTYWYRILDRYDKTVASLAVFTDNDRNYQPDKYEYECLGTSTIFRYKTYKIKGQDMAVLEDSDNPFAVVVLTALISIQEKDRKPEELLELAVELVKRLLKKGFSREKADQLLTFLKSFLNFEKKEIFLKFEEKIDELTEKKWSMGIKESVLQEAEDQGIEKGIAQGIEKGMAKGIEKGIAQGIEKGMAKGIEKGIAQGIEEGMAQGIEKGIAQGIEKGMAQGIEEGMAKGIEEGIAKGIEKGMAKGIEEGIAKGEQIGLEKGKSVMVANLLLKSNFSIEAIADFVEVSIDFVTGIRNKLPSASN